MWLERSTHLGGLFLKNHMHCTNTIQKTPCISLLHSFSCSLEDCSIPRMSNISSFILWIPPAECLQVCFFFFCQRTEPNLKPALALAISVTLDESPHLLESQFSIPSMGRIFLCCCFYFSHGSVVLKNQTG